MKRAYCTRCEKVEIWQAVEQQPLIHRPMHRFDWSIAIVLLTYFCVIAFVVANRGPA
jgi:hypothetical protein